MTRQIRFNAFDMNCVAHQSPGLWTHPRDRSWQYKDVEYWTELAATLEREIFDGIFITACDGQNARAQDTAERMGNQQRIASIGDDRASLSDNPRRRSACPSNTTPASDVMRPPSKAAVIFLRSTAGNENGRRLLSVMADMAWMRLREGSASATNPYIKSTPYAPSASRNPSSVELRGANTLRGYGHNHAPFFCKFCVDR